MKFGFTQFVVALLLGFTISAPAFEICDRALKLSEDSTESAKQALAEFFQGDAVKENLKNWKRLDKSKVGSQIHRSFRANDGTEVVVVFDPSIASMIVQHGNAPIAKGNSIEVIKAPKMVDPERPDFTGRVLWDKGEFEDSAYMFYVGAEVKRGFLDDQENPVVEAFVQKLFWDHQVDTTVSDSLHAVFLNPKETKAELKRLVADRLTAAGAIRMKPQEID